MDRAARGAVALTAGRHEDAINEYTAAIALNPSSPDYFIKRSTAYQRSKPPKLDLALNDADNAVLLAVKRARRELIADAQMRRATVLFHLERYGDAGFLFGIVKRLNDKEKTIQIWENKVMLKLKDLSEEDAKARVTVEEIPTAKPKDMSKDVDAETKPPPTVVQTPPNKIKHDWYQTNDKVILTLLARGVPKDKAVVEIHEHSVSISFPTVADSTYEYTLDPLYALIVPQESNFNISPAKVEVTLKKATPGQKWHSLEGDGSAIPTARPAESTTDAAVKQAVLSQDKAPAYPTSSKSGPKNWDKLADDLTKKPKPKAGAEAEDATADGSYEDLDEEDGDPASAFFKKLYKNADPDTRRAMMKSYQESSGTVLSTNWTDVGAREIETQPPDGMEAKQWDK